MLYRLDMKKLEDLKDKQVTFLNPGEKRIIDATLPTGLVSREEVRELLKELGVLE